MGCAGAGLALLLALAVPASIARTTLIGAAVVIVLIAVCASGGVLVRTRSRPAGEAGESRRSARSSITGIAVLAVVYLALVTVIHTA